MKGYVTKIDSRETKFGTYYDIYIDNKKYGAGKFPPKGVAAGDYVEFEAEAKGDYFNLKAGTLKKSEAPAGTPAPVLPKPSAITMDRQDVISRQAALNTALAFVDILQKEGALPAGAAKLSADKKADKIEAIVMHYTQKFHRLSTGVEYELPEDDVESGITNWDEAE